MFVQVKSGISNSAFGAIDTKIGTTPTEDVLHGLEATIIAEKEFSYELVPSELTVSQDDLINVCVILEGGG